MIGAYKHHLPQLDGYICTNGNVCAHQPPLSLHATWGVIAKLTSESEHVQIDFRRLEHVVAMVAASEEAVLKERKKNFRRRQLQEKALLRELAQRDDDDDDGDDDDDDDGGHRRGKGKEAGHKLVRYKRKEGKRSREDEAGEIEKECLDEDEEEEDLVRIGESGWRDRYVMQKFGVPSANREFYQGYACLVLCVSCRIVSCVGRV